MRYGENADKVQAVKEKMKKLKGLPEGALIEVI
jgi:hypothetical protein